MNPVEATLRKAIEDNGLTGSDQRRHLYDSFARRIEALTTGPDGTIDTGKRDAWKALMQSARAAIEADHLTLPDIDAVLAAAAVSKVEAGPKTEAAPERPGSIGWAVAYLRKHWPKVTAISGALTFLAEFLKPLGEYTGVLIGFGVATLIGSHFVRRIPALREWGEGGFATGLFVTIGAVTMLTVRLFVPAAEAKTNGALSAIPGVADLQRSLLHISEKVEKIATNTQRTAEATERTAADAARIATGTERVAAAAGGAKREISTDPGKELANLGISPPGYADAWIDALKRDDRRVYDLLTKAEFRPDTSVVLGLGHKENAAMLKRPNVRTALRTISTTVRDAICEPRFVVDGSNPYEMNRSVEAVVGYVQNLGVGEFRSYCKDPNLILEALRRLQRETWTSQCRKTLEQAIRRYEPNFRCDFGRISDRRYNELTDSIALSYTTEFDYLSTTLR